MSGSVTEFEFLSAAAALGVSLPSGAFAAFERYFEELVRANERTNLTRIVARDEVFAKHFLDSLACLPMLGEGTRTLVDVGSGAGLPGLVVAIARPDVAVTLIESAARKAEFLERVVEALGLASAVVVTGRAEEAGRDAGHRERHDVAVARALSRTSVLAEYLLPLVRVGGRMLALKGTDPTIEVAEAAFGEFGGRLATIERVEVPCVEGERHLVVVDKVATTPERYPRRPGVPEKRPVTASP
jgi:16S rRNA (guanine527-N7)-methyltransferase